MLERYLEIKTQHLFTSEKYFSILGIERYIQMDRNRFSRGKAYINIGKENRELLYVDDVSTRKINISL